MAKENNIIVYCEYDDGHIADVSLELLTKGRTLADELGVELQAVVAGNNLAGIETQVMPYGVDTLFKVEDKRMYPYTSLPHSSLLINLFKETKPQIAFMGATCIGRDLGPRVSSALHSGLTADCTALELGSHTDAQKGTNYENLLYQIRPAFGGNIVATIVNPECRPQMATVREGVMKKEIRDPQYQGKIVELNVADYVSDEDFVVEIINREVSKSKVNLKGSPIIVAGGYGVGSKENFDLLQQLADTLGAEVGASRAAVDAGWVEHERQIGQTGVTVRPKLYIACGISGQIQHLAGMQDSSLILSINSDPDAPINAVADYVITGRFEDVVPKLIKYYKKEFKIMANFFTDNPDLKHHLGHPMMRRIVELKERNFADADKYDYAPHDFEDAMDSYEKVLEIVGDICANTIAANAEDVDHNGPRVVDGHVQYAEGTTRNLEACRKAGLMGMAMPRRFGGLNFPITPYIMAADIVSRADTGFENIWGLQDCAETIYEFANEDQHNRFIPRVCEGETMSMDLTEPDAGSDLQSVMLKATQREDGSWVLNGVKRFITNGDSDIHLVLARSEEGTHDGRGLSMFIYDKRNGGVTVRRIENKMGIKGSPTCELVYKDAPAELVGERRLGLIKYVMALMNGARLGIAAQSVGVSEIAYREALAYARDRKQFGKSIIEFPAVAEILSLMKAKLDASRTLLYACSRFVDMYKVYDDIMRERSLTKEERAERKAFNRLADAFTPLAKGLTSEYCNQNAYDCIQIHGGSGFMKDYACERVYRDARITSIYEGTTQLQVVAAIRHVTTGTYLNFIREQAELETPQGCETAKNKLQAMTSLYEEAVNKINDAKNPQLLDFMARRLVEMGGHIVMGYLLMDDVRRGGDYRRSLNVYVNYGEAEVAKHIEFINKFNVEQLKDYEY